MTKNPRPLTQPRKGEPNHGKFCNAPGSLPPESNLPMQPSLKEQMHGAEKDSVQVPPFDHKACILCDHVIVQKILGNKCKLSGALCCYMRSCPEEERKRREAVKAKPEPKYYLITDDDLETIRGYVIGAMQGEEPTKIEELMMSEFSCIRSRSADLAGESIKAFTKGHVAGSTAENRRALEILDGFYDNIKVAHRHDTSNYSEGLLDGIDLSITEIKNKSLRLAQPEPKERDPE